MGEDVPLEIDTGRDLDQSQAFPGQVEHRALGDVEDALTALARVLAAEGQVVDLLDKLGCLALLPDP